MEAKPKVILFDFDYTLADPSKGEVECINYSLERINVPSVPDNKIYSCIGLSLENVFMQLVKPTKQHEKLYKEFERCFILRADEIMSDSTILFSYTLDVIKYLRQCGVRLAIVSTKFRRIINPILERDDILDCFEVIVGGEDTSLHKPNPQGLKMALSKLALTPDDSLYIGDSITDAQTAYNFNTPFIGVLSGFSKKSDLVGYSTTITVLDSIQELPLLFGW